MSLSEIAVADGPARISPPVRPLPYRLALPFITLLSLALWAAVFRAGAFVFALLAG